MHEVILLINLIAIGLAGGAALHVRHLARMAPQHELRVGWFWAAVIVFVVLLLGIYATFSWYMSAEDGTGGVIWSLLGLFGAGGLFAVALLSRLTARELLATSELEVVAHTDALTGLPNRRQFDAVMPIRIELANRRNQTLSLVVLNIDHFKLVNEEHGEAWGDQVLAHLGQMLEVHKREDDMAFRLDGETFAVLALQAPLAQGGALAERLRFTIEHTPLTNRTRRTAVTVSLGVANLTPGDDVNSLLARAEAAVRNAKEQGRNRAVLAPAPVAT